MKITDKDKNSIIFGTIFVALIVLVNYIPEDIMLTNATKYMIGISFIFLDLCHKNDIDKHGSGRLVFHYLFVGAILSFVFSHKDFAIPAILSYFTAFTLEVFIFQNLYKQNKQFGYAMLYSNLVPAFVDCVAWSYMIGSSHDIIRIQTHMTIIIFAALFVTMIVCEATAYKILGIISATMFIFIAIYSTGYWVDPAAEKWANFILGLFGYGNVSLDTEAHRSLILSFDIAISALCSLVPIFIVARIFRTFERRGTWTKAKL